MGKLNVRSISAITLAVADMARSVDFYHDKIGLEMLYGGGSASFTGFKVGDGFLNLILDPERDSRDARTWWGRLIFHVDDVDALHLSLVQAGLSPLTEPADASWGERYFHINDPDGHELSFARPIEPPP
jgi:catechol 2,3-dioxygenase-like lactoylglutathione lyase family enzyme